VKVAPTNYVGATFTVALREIAGYILKYKGKAKAKQSFFTNMVA
jgi:hypothetical protein